MRVLFLFIATIATYFAGVSFARASKLNAKTVTGIADSTIKAFDDAMKQIPTPVLKPSILTGRLSADDVKILVEKTIRENFPAVDPLMARAMIEIESSRKPRAERYETHLGESSVGLMQTLVSTAQDMARNFGATKYGIPTKASLYNPAISVYFGVAYLDWLRRYGVDEEKIVRNYNGGPRGWKNGSTLHYWEKYKQAKARL